MAELKVRIGGDATGFAAAVSQAQGIGNRFALNMNKTLAGSIGSAFAGGAVIAAGKNLVDFAGHMTDLADAAGLTTTKLQELSFAGMQSGATPEDWAKAARNLANARADALKNPSGDQAQAFTKLGIGPEQLAGLGNTGDLIDAVGAAVQRLNIDANSTPFILDLIGNRGSVILPAMKAGLAEAADEAHRLNSVLSADAAASLDKLGDEGSKAAARFKVMGAEIALFFLRAIDVISTGIQALVPATMNVVGHIQKAAGFDKAGQSNIDAAQAERTRLRNELLDRYDNKVKPKAKGVDLGTPEAKTKEDAEDKARAKEAAKLASIYKHIAELNERIARAHMTDAEVLARMKTKLDELKARQKEIAEGEGNDPLTIAQDKEEIAALEADIAEREGRAKPKDNNKFGMKSDSATSVGALIGGYATGGMVNDILGRQQLTETQKVARNTEAMLNLIRARGFVVSDDGF
jgi:hypothetical protein